MLRHARHLLAAAGLQRLDMVPAGPLNWTAIVLPAAGQGALAVQCRADDEAHCAFGAAKLRGNTGVCHRRAPFLNALDGSCRTPIAALATITDDTCICMGVYWPMMEVTWQKPA